MLYEVITEVLNAWGEVSDRVAAQPDDAQAVTMNDLVTTLEVNPVLDIAQEQNLIAYIGILQRDARFALVKSLVKIPTVAAILCKDEYDAVVTDAIAAISREAS